MKRLCAMFAAAMAGAALVALTPARAADKGTVVDLDGVKSTAPADWKEEKPEGTFRLAQFKLTAAEGDKADAEVVIFKGISGSAKENVEFWQKKFQPPEGKKIDDVSKVTEFKMGGNKATRLDIEGTYKFKAQPNNPQSKEELRPGYKMVAIQYEGKNNYHIRFVGPAKTVDKYVAGFDDWIKGFKE